MRLTPGKSHGRRAVFLIQCLVFIAAWFVIANFAFKALFTLVQGTNRLRATGQDIVSAMNIGEQWRADIRAATGPIETKLDQAGLRLEIPHGDLRIIYFQDEHKLIRRHADGTQTVTLLRDVANCSYVREQRGPVTAWRWELEMIPNDHRSKTKPLFTFLAVEATAEDLKAAANPAVTTSQASNLDLKIAGGMPAAQSL